MPRTPERMDPPPRTARQKRKARFHTFATSAEAEAHISRIGRSRAYTKGGAPPLPRCDHPQWTGATFNGKIAPCSCTSRTDIDPECPHVIMRHGEVEEIDGAFRVKWSRREVDAQGETVDGVRIDRPIAGTSALTAAQRRRSRPHWPRRARSIADDD